MLFESFRSCLCHEQFNKPNVKLKSVLKMVLTKTKTEVVVTSTFNWRIENYSSLNVHSANVDLSDDSKLFLEMRRNTYHNHYGYTYDQPYFRIESKKTGKFKISISETQSGAKIESEVAPSQTLATQYNTQYNTGRNRLTNDIKGFMETQNVNSYLRKNCLTLFIEITEPQELTQKPKIISDFQTMKDIPDLSDFTYSVGGENFPVHKVVLAARSSVFLKMFTEDFKNSTVGELNDISKEAFADFLNFVYLGELKNLDQNAKELLIIADKFKFPDLQIIAEDHVLETLDEDNAVKTYQFAHKYNCEELKQSSFNLIQDSFDEFNISLPDEFIDEPKSVMNAIMMRKNLLDATKLEVLPRKVMKKKK